jgi:hypothetical protein
LELLDGKKINLSETKNILDKKNILVEKLEDKDLFPIIKVGGELQFSEYFDKTYKLILQIDNPTLDFDFPNSDIVQDEVDFKKYKKNNYFPLGNTIKKSKKKSKKSKK